MREIGPFTKYVITKLVYRQQGEEKDRGMGDRKRGMGDNGRGSGKILSIIERK